MFPYFLIKLDGNIALLISVMFPHRKRTIMFPSRFCYYISILSWFRRYISDFLRPLIAESLLLEKIEVYKGKNTPTRSI